MKFEDDPFDNPSEPHHSIDTQVMIGDAPTTETAAALTEHSDPSRAKRLANGAFNTFCRHNGIFYIYEVFSDLFEKADADERAYDQRPAA
jgi:hypothetical protein